MNTINEYRDPKWWTTEDDAAWEQTKAALKCDWDQTQPTVAPDEPVTAADKKAFSHSSGDQLAPIESAHRFAYGAKSRFGRKYPEWNMDLENRLRFGWNELYPERAEHWETDLEALRYGWEYEEGSEGASEITDPRTGPISSFPESKPRYRILVVEDDPDIRSLNTEVLIHYGYAVDAAGDGALAYEALCSGRYDLMVTDNSMPKMTGLELLRKLHDTGLALPTIMATSLVPNADFQRQPWLMPAAALIKPYTLNDLVKKVREVLHHTAGNDECPSR